MKIKEIGPRRGMSLASPLDPPMGMSAVAMETDIVNILSDW